MRSAFAFRRDAINVRGCAQCGENSPCRPGNFRANLSPALRDAPFDIVAGRIIRRPPTNGEGRNGTSVFGSPETAPFFTPPTNIRDGRLRRSSQETIWRRNSRVRTENIDSDNEHHSTEPAPDRTHRHGEHGVPPCDYEHGNHDTRSTRTYSIDMANATSRSETIKPRRVADEQLPPFPGRGGEHGNEIDERGLVPPWRSRRALACIGVRSAWLAPFRPNLRHFCQ